MYSNANRRPMKKSLVVLACLGLAAMLLAGCRVHWNVNKKEPSAEEMLANRALAADPVAYNTEGSYRVTFRYEKGGFKKMDLSRAYVAYYPLTITDRIDAIVGEDTEDIPPLPADAQEAIDEVTGAGQLQKIAVITIETVDDNTLTVSFTDRDEPISGREYYFLIPNEGLSGSVIPG